MANTYYKLVALEDPDWLKSEFVNGRARFGWSGPGTDLRRIADTPQTARTPDQQVTWRYTQFLINRIGVGDRIVYQFQQPLRSFLIGEVIAPGYASDSEGRPDFNHTLHVRPLVDRPVPVSSVAVPGFLRHDLSKRGQYYCIYSEESTAALDRLASEPLPSGERDEAIELTEASAAISQKIVDEIRRRWPAKGFERFAAWLFEQTPGVEVRELRDSRQGWDLRIRVRDPLSDEPLFDDVPVQCKNFSGRIDDERPIDDLKRSIRESKSGLAYLIILGGMDKAYRHRIAEAEEALSREMGNPVRLFVLDEERVAKLYVQALSGQPALDA